MPSGVARLSVQGGQPLSELDKGGATRSSRDSRLNSRLAKSIATGFNPLDLLNFCTVLTGTTVYFAKNFGLLPFEVNSDLIFIISKVYENPHCKVE